MIRTILLDFDGTVFDTVNGIVKSAQYALEKHGMEAETELLCRFAGPPLIQTFRELFNVSQELAVQLGADFKERYIPVDMYESEPFPGMVELIESLRASGKIVAITTMKPLFMAEAILDRAGLSTLFDAVYGSPNTDMEAPKEKIISDAMTALSAQPDETIMVGDTKYDIIGAHLAGIKAIGVRYGYAVAGELENAGADIIVDSVDQLSELLFAN